MNIQIRNSLFVMLFLTSCSSDLDPLGQMWWLLIGFPILGLASMIGGDIQRLFRTKEEKKENKATDMTSALIFGIIAIALIYLILKIIF